MKNRSYTPTNNKYDDKYTREILRAIHEVYRPGEPLPPDLREDQEDNKPKTPPLPPVEKVVEILLMQLEKNSLSATVDQPAAEGVLPLLSRQEVLCVWITYFTRLNKDLLQLSSPRFAQGLVQSIRADSPTLTAQDLRELSGHHAHILHDWLRSRDSLRAVIARINSQWGLKIHISTLSRYFYSHVRSDQDAELEASFETAQQIIQRGNAVTHLLDSTIVLIEKNLFETALKAPNDLSQLKSATQILWKLEQIRTQRKPRPSKRAVTPEEAPALSETPGHTDPTESIPSSKSIVSTPSSAPVPSAVPQNPQQNQPVPGGPHILVPSTAPPLLSDETSTTLQTSNNPCNDWS